MAESGLLPPPAFLSTPGEPTLPWSQWKRMFDNYLLAIDSSEFSAERKQAILLHALGPEGQRIFYSLPLLGDTSDDVYTKAIKTLDKYFKPKVNVVAERYRFRQRSQLPNEPVDNYMCALRELSITCEFGSFCDEMLRDQLVEKTNFHRIRERLLLETDLKLDKAIEIARQVEQAVKEAKSMETYKDSHSTHLISRNRVNHHSRGKPQPREQNQRNEDKRQNFQKRGQQACFRCGAMTHLANFQECKARGQKCNNCGKIGHIAKVCLQRRVVREITDNCEDNHDVNSIHEHNGHEGNVRVLGISKDVCARPSITCHVHINGIDIPMLVDTGSDVTLLNVNLFDKYFVREALLPCHTMIKSYSQDNVAVLGSFPTTISYKGRNTKANILVVAKGTSLIGKDVIHGLGLQVDGKTMSCHAISNITIPSTAPTPTASTPVPDSEFEREVHNKFPNLFSAGLGKIKGFRHKIKIKPEVKPVQQPLRRVPFAVRDKVAGELQHLQDEGVIEAVNEASDWVSPTVIAWKKNGGVRLCVDLRKVNDAVVVEKHPLPNIEEMFTELRNAKYFSKLDLKSAYHQLELDESSRAFTTFITHKGLFRYKRVCFGLASAPSCFQRVMSSVLKGLDGVLCFIDDIIVFGKNKSRT